MHDITTLKAANEKQTPLNANGCFGINYAKRVRRCVIRLIIRTGKNEQRNNGRYWPPVVALCWRRTPFRCCPRNVQTVYCVTLELSPNMQDTNATFEGTKKRAKNAAILHRKRADTGLTLPASFFTSTSTPDRTHARQNTSYTTVRESLSLCGQSERYHQASIFGTMKVSPRNERWTKYETSEWVVGKVQQRSMLRECRAGVLGKLRLKRQESGSSAGLIMTMTARVLEVTIRAADV
jgi:hypothetical protein